VPLGSWSFAPGAGHQVTLAAAAEGATIADAMLFVAAGTQPANLLYVHADHLGSPQKLTDAGQATVWDGVFDPFGEEVAIAGLAAMQMRFPGQYADEETGYSYNYSRDYDPAIGRYLQSDPIGLFGGLNTFAYGYNNPISSVDPQGTCAQSALAGAALGAAMEMARQALVPLDCFKIDWWRIAEAAAWGAAFGCGFDLALAGAGSLIRVLAQEAKGGMGGIGGIGGEIGGASAAQAATGGVRATG
jgi:RHS repeat-associated protein